MKIEEPIPCVEFEQVYNWLKCNGNYYNWESHDGKPVLTRIDNKEVETQIKKAKEIAGKIKNNLDAEAVIVESVLHLMPKDIDRLYNLVNSKTRKYKSRTRKGHCVDMKIGGFILPIVD